MVDVNPVNKNTVVNVNSSGNVSEIKTTTPQHYYDGLAKQWAISADKVQGLDYSSKYYAEKSRESAQNAQAYVEQVNNVKNEAITEITTTKNETIDGLFNISNTSKEEILQIEENAIKNIEETKEDSKELIIKEAQQQLKNIESTGFYMRDDKLYFINSKGEEEEFKSGGAGAVMFDTKIADHILEGNEAKGWALQGTYVSGALYPDFYAKCLEEKNNATATEITLADSALTMFVNDNGHQFYNITDKSIVDAFYNICGVADFYGIDEENERVFLPRNKYFAIKNPVLNIPVVGNGMCLGLTDGTNYGGLRSYTSTMNALVGDISEYGRPVGDTGSGTDVLQGDTGLTTDPTKSGIVADSSNVIQPDEGKYLYYCVGNTEVTQAITNVTEVTTSENDTIPLFTGMYFDFKPNNASWLKAGEQQNNAGIYKTCYDALVQIVNGVNKYDLKVINKADIVSGVIYDEYWVLDQDNLTFRTPLTIATKSLSGGVVGNGMTLGLTDGTENVGLFPSGSHYENNSSNAYGVQAGTSLTQSGWITNKSLGVTSDPSKSGIIAEQSNAQLYFKVANAVQNLELLDTGEVLEELAIKLDRSNKQEIISWGIPDYSRGIIPSHPTSSAPFTAPADGIFVDCFYYSTENTSTLYVNGVRTKIATRTGASNRDNRSSVTVPLSKGDVIYWSTGSTNTFGIGFYPFKGSN